MAATYTLIKSTTLSSAQANVQLTAIPSTYTDLVVRASIRGDDNVAVSGMWVRFNGNSTALYSDTILRGSGSAATSLRQNGMTFTTNTYNINTQLDTASTFSNFEMYLPNYTSTSSKPLSSFTAQENNATGAWINIAANLYRNTTAITSMLFQLDRGNINTGSSFYLYGISNA